MTAHTCIFHWYHDGFKCFEIFVYIIDVFIVIHVYLKKKKKDYYKMKTQLKIIS